MCYSFAIFHILLVLGIYSLFDSAIIKQPGGNAILIAPQMPRVLRCLRFEYNVHGRDVGELTLRDSKDEVLWSHIGLPSVSAYLNKNTKS